MWGGMFKRVFLWDMERQGTAQPDFMRRLYISQSLSAKIRDDDGKVFERVGRGAHDRF